MLELYLFVRIALPLLVTAGIGWLVARVINTRLSRLPPREVPLPEHSRLPSPAAQRRYRRLRRRRPNLRSIRLQPKIPRSWVAMATAVFIGSVAACALLMPNGARFQVMVESLRGYPATVIEVQVPAAQQDALLQAWAPVLQQTARPITMRYRVARTAGMTEVHDVLPAQVRRRGQVLQIATAQPVDAHALREALQDCVPLPPATINMHERNVAPWREAGWQALAPARAAE
ncbi:hypothetical protein DCO49_06680 [Stenotrophomonas sp. SPM]|uniref:hypothetical protein n=1 Tax=Stenotrophomonas sp. SPM TaxID=2170735 RepID=UPI000DE5F7EE|nr:hypothetical protein [Stenotrophomonas sp. SPM]PWB27897.1 hypothetical protein DCO49_06680 [Stenotrophomonas sp. SPM]